MDRMSATGHVDSVDRDLQDLVPLLTATERVDDSHNPRLDQDLLSSHINYQHRASALRMKNTDIPGMTETESDNQNDETEDASVPWWSRERFTGAVLFNAATCLLPAIYGTLAKLWIAYFDPKMVVTTDVYTYVLYMSFNWVGCKNY